uniref:Uncharacterized protein n=1 Tax=blood disease bacterium R229 TaxID=741978 RepID=G2ZNJ4_9RALS|nr:conserved hypothetical protein [blood disease bacterium R229]
MAGRESPTSSTKWLQVQCWFQVGLTLPNDGNRSCLALEWRRPSSSGPHLAAMATAAPYAWLNRVVPAERVRKELMGKAGSELAMDVHTTSCPEKREGTSITRTSCRRSGLDA